MKPEMRHKLAQLPFEEKIRKVGELIWLSRKIGAERLRDDAQTFPQSATRNPKSDRAAAKPDAGKGVPLEGVREKIRGWAGD